MDQEKAISFVVSTELLVECTNKDYVIHELAFLYIISNPLHNEHTDAKITKISD